MNKETILTEALKLRYNAPKSTLGQCLRVAAGESLLADKYSYLSKLDGLVAQYEFDKILDSVNKKGS